MIKVVLDCNVLVAAGISNGKCRQVLTYVLQNTFIITSETIEKEYREVFLRPKFSTQQSQLMSLMDDISAASFMIDPEPTAWLSPDPKDQPYLDTAITAQADYLITGNRNDFPDNPDYGLKILSPGDFLLTIQDGK